MAVGRITFGEVTSSAFAVFQSSLTYSKNKKISQLSVLAADKQGGHGSWQSPSSSFRLSFSGVLTRLTAHQYLGKRARQFEHILTACAMERLLQKYPFGRTYRLSWSRRGELLCNKFFMDEIYQHHLVVSNVKIQRKVPHASDCLTKL